MPATACACAPQRKPTSLPAHPQLRPPSPHATRHRPMTDAPPQPQPPPYPLRCLPPMLLRTCWSSYSSLARLPPPPPSPSAAAIPYPSHPPTPTPATASVYAFRSTTSDAPAPPPPHPPPDPPQSHSPQAHAHPPRSHPWTIQSASNRQAAEHIQPCSCPSRPPCPSFPSSAGPPYHLPTRSQAPPPTKLLLTAGCFWGVAPPSVVPEPCSATGSWVLHDRGQPDQRPIGLHMLRTLCTTQSHL